MKTLLRVLALFGLALAAFAQPYYVNTNWVTVSPGQQLNQLPISIVYSNYVLYNPTIPDLAIAGWRQVLNIRSPAAGLVVDSYSMVTTNIYYANLLVATQHNISQAADAGFTNNPAWTTNLIFEAQQFRTILRGYAGAGAETNYDVSGQTLVRFFVNKFANSSMTTNDTINLSVIQLIMPNILVFTNDTRGFPWRLIP
jgi:hypothetical protein